MEDTHERHRGWFFFFGGCAVPLGFMLLDVILPHSVVTNFWFNALVHYGAGIGSGISSAGSWLLTRHAGLFFKRCSFLLMVFFAVMTLVILDQFISFPFRSNSPYEGHEALYDMLAHSLVVSLVLGTLVVLFVLAAIKRISMDTWMEHPLNPLFYIIVTTTAAGGLWELFELWQQGFNILAHHTSLTPYQDTIKDMAMVCLGGATVAAICHVRKHP